MALNDVSSHTGFLCGIESIEFQNWFSRPLKKY